MCNTIVNIPKQCENNLGGLQEIYVIDQDFIGQVIETDNVINTLTTLSAQIFLPFYQLRNTSNYTEELATDFNNGTSVYTTNLNLFFARRDKIKSKALTILAQGQRELAFIVKDLNDKYWYLPNMRLATNTGGSGTNKSDGSNYLVSFINDDLNNINEINPDLIPDLISNLSNFIIDTDGNILITSDSIDSLIWL